MKELSIVSNIKDDDNISNNNSSSSDKFQYQDDV